ncbi:sodium- and chloride-dependent neutral and basic amino acid transporter B(0+)-like [Spea bombifrons]|uniref:sodium- and chloride-dependent neutral and basic amino acid transporter B(0+)-like n=1 Tax=Spea bombifrons TaxID=233779 RepID=UPI0023495220|nr:sodium- and chloride-dependent neutral and basic amino acid transporter B(0+)-like [Spea bombifrons]
MGNIQAPAFLRCCRKKSAEIKDDEITDNENGEENSERETWTRKSDYLLSMVGYAVGLGNVWRFPYLAFNHGGGAFLIPYIIMLAVAGLPLFFLECSLGQFASLGPVAVWEIVPLFQGVGFTMVLVSALVSIYYNVIVAYSLYYLFASFRSYLPWSECFEWADENCFSSKTETCNVTLGDETLLMNISLIRGTNLSCINDASKELPTKQYWEKVALRLSGGLGETGVVVWHLALCLLLAWIIVVASLAKGIKSSGKVVYFTALFPYVVLLILLIRGATLEGARDGIEYFIGQQSNITKLSNGDVWRDAATQIFYSLSTAWGGLTALSSYNKFHNNCYLDSIVVCVINCLTSLFAGFVIFSIIGHMALISGKPVSQVINEGFDLAFIAYPEALAQLPVAPLWSILFFFMLLTLGLDSQFAMIETITTSIQDAFPKAMKKMRIPITIAVCAVLFLLGLPCVSQAGLYWVLLIDTFCGGWTILIVAVLELIAIIWIYGGNRVIEDIEMMLGKKSFLFWLWWRMCWYFISPVILAVILVWSLITFQPPKYGDVLFPEWGIILGALMVVFCLIWILVVAVWKIIKTPGTLWQRIVKCCKPTKKWGPALAKNRGERYKHMNNVEHVDIPDIKDDKNMDIPDMKGAESMEAAENMDTPDFKGFDNTAFQSD